MIVKLKEIRSGATRPVRATPGSHGYDLALAEEVFIGPGETKLLSTGLALAEDTDPGIAMTIWPRSSTFKKYGLMLGNSIGLIDTDYTGEILIMLHNTKHAEHVLMDNGHKPLWHHAIEETTVRLPAGTKVAQLVFLQVAYPEVVIDSGVAVERAARGGFGSTGA